MDFDPTPAQAALRARAEAFCREHCPDAHAGAIAALHEALATAGLLGWWLPAADGGGGGDAVDACILSEVLAQHSVAAVGLLRVHAIPAALIALTGTSAQREAYVRGVAEGRVRLAFAFAEPNAGIVTAAAVGDGWVLDGSTRDTPGACDADAVLTVARTRFDGRASRATSLFLVPRTAPGLTVTPLRTVAGDAIASCRVDYRQVHLGPADRLGPEHGAWPALMLVGGFERLVVAAACVGMAQAALADVMARAQRAVPVVQHRLADMATEIEAMRLLTHRAAWSTAEGRVRPREIGMATLYAGQRLAAIVTRATALLGGRAEDAVTSLRLREARLWLDAGGSLDVQRDVVAKSLGL